MNVILLVIGALPFVVGGIQNWYMITYADSVLPYRVIAFAFLFVWGGSAFLMNKKGENTKRIVVFMNLLAFLDLVLIGVQELVFHTYWGNSIGGWTQMFYLPVLGLGFDLTNWSHTVFTAYAVGFILMIIASLVGCKIRER